MKVLLIEDNPADRRLMHEIFKMECRRCDLKSVPDGVEALKYLRKEAPYKNAATPELVLLDFNLPKKDGREVLAEIKNDAHLGHIPVIVLTTSDAPSDIQAAYHGHASCFLRKPSDFNDFSHLARALNDFWIDHVRFSGEAA